MIATLIYLAVQIKQNTLATRTASFQASTDALNQANLLLASSRELAEVFEKSLAHELNEIDPISRRQYLFVLLAVFRTFESAYFQRNLGVLEQQSWLRHSDVATYHANSVAICAPVGRLKVEFVYATEYATLEDAHSSVFEYIEMFYNRVRRHSAINYKSPIQHEQVYTQCT